MLIVVESLSVREVKNAACQDWHEDPDFKSFAVGTGLAEDGPPTWTFFGQPECEFLWGWFKVSEVYPGS